MNTLFISLLRLGDLIMHLEVIKLYAKNYPQEKISILVNDEFKHIANLIPASIHLVYFPRKQLQEQVVDRTYHFRYAYEFVAQLIEGLNGKNFDKVVNLTHNRISGYVAGLIFAKEKIGLHFDKNFQGHLENSGWRKLNNEFSSATSSKENYIQILLEALQLTPLKRLLIHPFSNDPKKIWPISNFTQLAKSLLLLENVGSVSFVGTEDEFNAAGAELDSFSKVSVPFERLREELMWSDGLIAVDSSVKHLALSLRQNVLEVSLGSASPSKFSWSPNNAVVGPKATCFPCSYSNPCIHAAPICHDEVTVNEVLNRAKVHFGLHLSKERKYERNSELFA